MSGSLNVSLSVNFWKVFVTISSDDRGWWISMCIKPAFTTNFQYWLEGSWDILLDRCFWPFPPRLLAQCLASEARGAIEWNGRNGGRKTGRGQVFPRLKSPLGKNWLLWAVHCFLLWKLKGLWKVKPSIGGLCSPSFLETYWLLGQLSNLCHLFNCRQTFCYSTVMDGREQRRTGS